MLELGLKSLLPAQSLLVLAQSLAPCHRHIGPTRPALRVCVFPSFVSLTGGVSDAAALASKAWTGRCRLN